MADVRIRFGGAMGGGAPVYAPIPDATAKITSSASSQQTTAVVNDGDFVSIVSIGGAVAFAIGQNPTAIATSGDVVQSGERLDLGPLKPGDKVAIIDAA